MRKFTAIVGVVALLATVPGVVGEAAADHDEVRFGAGVRIGGFHLSIGYSPRDRGYYYRTSDRIGYDHYRCTDRCSRRGREWYHHESCPVVLHLLHLERIHPHSLYTRHAPSYDGRFRGYDPYYYDRANYRGDDYDDYYDDDRSARHRGRHRGWDRGRGHGRNHGRNQGHYHGRTYCSVRH